MANEMKYFPLLTLLISFSVFADLELSDEYKALRTEAVKDVRRPYEECRAKEGKEKYELAIRKCESQGKGINVGGGCAHVASRNPSYSNAVNYNCAQLEPTVEQYKNAVSKAVSESGISIYK